MKTIYEARCVCGEDVFSDDGKDAVDCGACGRSMCAEMFKQTEVADIISETISPPPMTHDSVSEVAKIINCLPGTSEAHGEVAAKIMNLLASREQSVADNAARAVRDAVERSCFSWVLTNGAQVGKTCIEAARTAAAPFLKGK